MEYRLVVVGTGNVALRDWVKGKTGELADRAKTAQLGETLKETTGKLTELVKNAQLGDVAKEAATGLVSRAKSAMRDLANERAAQRAKDELLRAEQERERQIWAHIDNRFPPSRFPRTPYLMVHDYGQGPNLHEDLGLWIELLQEWPDEPTNEVVREQREELYWRRELEKNLTRANDGSVALIPKQSIMDIWWNYEKWNFRRFYAATGVVHASVFSDELIENWLMVHRYDQVKKFNLADPREARALQKYEEAIRFVKNFWNHTVPAHREKWGNWYLFNIEQAFKKGVAPPARTFQKPSDDL